MEQNHRTTVPCSLGSPNWRLTVVKPKDVYRFRFSAKEAARRVTPYHCFDGTLIAKKDANGVVVLEDMYWEGCARRRFTVHELEEMGSLEFICNLEDVVEVGKNDLDYYDDEDCYELRIHAGYRNRYFVRMGAERSTDAMLSVIDEAIDAARNGARLANERAARYEDDRLRILGGDTSVYLP